MRVSLGGRLFAALRRYTPFAMNFGPQDELLYWGLVIGAFVLLVIGASIIISNH